MEQASVLPQMSARPAPIARTGKAPWSKAFLAGLPHLLYPLAVYGYSFTRWQPYRSENGYLLHPSALIFWALLAVGVALAALARWPRWSATWIGYGLVGAAEVLLVLPTTGIHVSEPLAIASGVAWIALILSVLTWTARQDALNGLLAVLPVMPMWYAYLALDGVRGDEAPLFYTFGLLMALIVAWVVRRGKPRLGLAWILVAVAAIALPLSYATVYFSNAVLAATPTPGGVISTFVKMFLGFACFCLPVWLTAIIRWRKQSR